ncbi:MAG: hypothetical protein Alpg2KO_27560 [Alphaproteobacteria bacterium]
MPQNNPWEKLAEQGSIEICFEDTKGDMFAVNWQDIVSKRASARENNAAKCLVVLRELASHSPSYNKYVAANREVEITPDTLINIYEQAGHPLPDALAKKIEQVREKQIKDEAERKRKQAEHEKNPPSHAGGGGGIFI